MTEIDLQNAVKAAIEDEILPKLTLFNEKPVRVFLHDLPISTEYEDEDDKYFPCCIVKLINGEIKTASDAQLTTIEIVIAIKDASEDMTGYQSLMILIQRIRDYFLRNAGIKGKFRLAYPVQWNISDEYSAPFFLGNVVTTWVTDVAGYVDPLDFL